MARGYVGTAVIGGGVASALCLLMVVATTPLGIGPTGVTLWFLSLMVALTCWLSLASYMIEGRLRPNTQPAAKKRNAWRRGIFLGGYITMLLALSSLKQLNARDAILFLLLILLVEFYLVMRG